MSKAGILPGLGPFDAQTVFCDALPLSDAGTEDASRGLGL